MRRVGAVDETAGAGASQSSWRARQPRSSTTALPLRQSSRPLASDSSSSLNAPRHPPDRVARLRGGSVHAVDHRTAQNLREYECRSRPADWRATRNSPHPGLRARASGAWLGAPQRYRNRFVAGAVAGGCSVCSSQVLDQPPHERGAASSRRPRSSRPESNGGRGRTAGGSRRSYAASACGSLSRASSSRSDAAWWPARSTVVSALS